MRRHLLACFLIAVVCLTGCGGLTRAESGQDSPTSASVDTPAPTPMPTLGRASLVEIERGYRVITVLQAAVMLMDIATKNIMDGTVSEADCDLVPLIASVYVETASDELDGPAPHPLLTEAWEQAAAIADDTAAVARDWDDSSIGPAQVSERLQPIRQDINAIWESCDAQVSSQSIVPRWELVDMRTKWLVKLLNRKDGIVGE